jgi:hypothetical protein
MADPPAFRTGYMSILLPVETGEDEVRRIIRESVIRALVMDSSFPLSVYAVSKYIESGSKGANNAIPCHPFCRHSPVGSTAGGAFGVPTSLASHGKAARKASTPNCQSWFPG